MRKWIVPIRLAIVELGSTNGTNTAVSGALFWSEDMHSSKLSSTFIALVLAVASGAGALTLAPRDAATACQQLQQALPGQVHLPGDILSPARCVRRY